MRGRGGVAQVIGGRAEPEWPIRGSAWVVKCQCLEIVNFIATGLEFLACAFRSLEELAFLLCTLV